MNAIEKLLHSLRTGGVQLWEETGSLRFRAPQGVLTAELRQAMAAHKAELLHHVRQAQAESTTGYLAIPALPAQPDYDLSHGQQRLWILDQLEMGITTHNMFTAHLLVGTLHRDLLERVFQEVIARHEILRTSFVTVGNEPRQRIHPATDSSFRVEYLDLRADADYQAQIDALAKQELIMRFDLTKTPLFRVKLMQLADDRHVFFLTLHHIISDGWSQEVLLKDIIAYYNAYTTGQPSHLTPLRIQYKEYAAWLSHLLSSEAVAEYEHYWLGKFREPGPVLTLPVDFPRPKLKEHLGMSHTFHLRGEQVDAIRRLSREQGVSLFMFFFAVLNTVLYRYTGLEDITVGTPVASRVHPDLAGQIGFYVNTLAFRTEFSGQDRFLDLLLNVKQTTIPAFKYQLYPFDLLVEKLGLKRDLSRHPLFDILYTYENARDRKKEMTLRDLSIEALPVGHCMDKFDIEFTVIDEEEHLLECYLNYNTALFRKETIEQLGAHLLKITADALRDVHCPLVDFVLAEPQLAASQPPVLFQQDELLFDFD